CQRYISALFTF
nr:immunoglobulin light chain junction region [Macaca mulatta]